MSGPSWRPPVTSATSSASFASAAAALPVTVRETYLGFL